MKAKEITEKLDYWLWLVLYRFGRKYKGIREEERIEARRHALRQNQWAIREWNRTNIGKESRLCWWFNFVMQCLRRRETIKGTSK